MGGRLRTAMISDATVMSKPVLRTRPFSAFPSPTVTPRRCLSHVSTTRCHVTLSGSMSRRAKRSRSSGVSSSGSASGLIPSLASRRRITGAKERAPFFLGHSRLNSASPLCAGRSQMTDRKQRHD